MQGFLNMLSGNFPCPLHSVCYKTQQTHFLCPTLFVTVEDPGFPSFIFFPDEKSYSVYSQLVQVQLCASYNLIFCLVQLRVSW